ncbi:MAG: Gfo/Idh/MocA family oxidoreductase [Clostridia bacterium]|nr:Gfo/Idh/MocA family oxidoreductase [Clostridia bacterium]
MEKLRLGVIGAGAFSPCHLEGIANVKNAELLAICDINLDNAKQKAEEYHIESVYTDYNELLAREDIDAVTLPLPDQVHKEITIAALRAGKHVLCEKPMSLNLDECKEMVKVARECGKELMVGQVGRYTPAFIKAKKLLDEGAIGELFLIESEYAHDYSHIGGTGGWRVTPEREPIIGGGCHAVDLIRMIAGNPIEVFAMANNKSLKDWPIHDCSMAVMKLPNDVIGKVMTSTGCKRTYTMRSTLYGTKGTIIFDNTSPTISLFKEKFTDDETFKDMSQQSLEIKVPVQVNNHNLGGEVEDFCKCILEGKPVVTSGVEGASTVSVCLAIVESFKTGEKITVDYDF